MSEQKAERRVLVHPLERERAKALLSKLGLPVVETPYMPLGVVFVLDEESIMGDEPEQRLPIR